MKYYLKNPVIMSGVVLGILFLFAGIFLQNQFVTGLKQTNAGLLSIFKYYYLYLGLLVVLVSVILSLLPFARQRLGDEKPEYSFFSWIALLYSTGMGSGLLLRAVQEPAYYLQNPPIAAESNQILSLQYTFFHWGLTPWAFYSLFGLLVAYNLYIKKADSFYTAIFLNSENKQKVQITNIFICLITVIGVVASLGLGAGQFVGGLNAYFNLNLGFSYLLAVVFLIGAVSTVSALTGIQKVIKFLADFDMVVSLLLLVFILVQLDLPNFFVNTTRALKDYTLYFVPMSLSVGSFRLSDAFLQDWTVFYWAFWLAWVPFTGIFIARVSRGRSIREFLIGTILIPTIATIIWFAAFGNKAFENITTEGKYNGQYDSVFTSLFNFLQTLPLSHFTVIVTVILILVALINSVDSAIFVLSMFSDNGESNPQKIHKIIWGAVITTISLSLILLGKESLLEAISNLLIIMALPFSFLYLYLICKFIWDNFLGLKLKFGNKN